MPTQGGENPKDLLKVKPNPSNTEDKAKDDESKQ